MSLLRIAEKARPPSPVEVPAALARGPSFEDRDWYASSRDLAHGLVVRELVETMPAALSEICVKGSDTPLGSNQ